MRAFDSEVVDAVWEAIEPRVPVPIDHHPKRGHRLRARTGSVSKGS